MPTTTTTCEFLTPAQLAILLADPNNTRLGGPYPSYDECRLLCVGGSGSGSGSGPPLVGYWPLNEGTGTIAHDLSGNNNNLSAVAGGSSPAWNADTPGPQAESGGCVSFTSNGIFSSTGVNLPYGASDRTASFWFKLPARADIVFSYGTSATFIIYDGESAIFSDGSHPPINSASAYSTDGAWHLYTMTWHSGSPLVLLPGRRFGQFRHGGIPSQYGRKRGHHYHGSVGDRRQSQRLAVVQCRAQRRGRRQHLRRHLRTMICPLDNNDFCARHQSHHKGPLRVLALDPSERGERFRRLWDRNAPPMQSAACVHLGEHLRRDDGLRDSVECEPCSAKTSQKIRKPLFVCAVHGRCTTDTKVDGVAFAAPGCLEKNQANVSRAITEVVIPKGSYSSVAFNPSLIDWRGRLLFCYRDNWSGSRLWMCELNPTTLQPQNKPVQLVLRHPLCAGGQEDPRLFVFQDRLHVQFSGVEMRNGSIRVHLLHARLTGDYRAGKTSGSRDTSRA